MKTALLLRKRQVGPETYGRHSWRHPAPAVAKEQNVGLIVMMFRTTKTAKSLPRSMDLEGRMKATVGLKEWTRRARERVGAIDRATLKKNVRKCLNQAVDRNTKVVSLRMIWTMGDLENKRENIERDPVWNIGVSMNRIQRGDMKKTEVSIRSLRQDLRMAKIISRRLKKCNIDK